MSEAGPIRIGVLSKSADLVATARLLEAVRSAGHESVFLPILRTRVTTGVDGGPSELEIGDRDIASLDVVIARVGSYLTSLGLAAVRAFERAGVPVLDSSDAILRARDKQRTIEELTAIGVAVPPTSLVVDFEQLPAAIEAVGGAPVVIKPVSGSQGQGVVLAESTAAALSTLESFLYLGRDVLVQRFVAESAGEDRRLFVVGDEVVAAMRRCAAPGDFRANHHRGGTVEGWSPDRDSVELAIRCAKQLGLAVAGVDIVVGSTGPLVLEVNSSPGLEAIEHASGIDVAGAIVAHAASLARGR